MKDFLGNDLVVGDEVIYIQGNQLNGVYSSCLGIGIIQPNFIKNRYDHYSVQINGKNKEKPEYIDSTNCVKGFELCRDDVEIGDYVFFVDEIPAIALELGIGKVVFFNEEIVKIETKFLMSDVLLSKDRKTISKIPKEEAALLKLGKFNERFL